MPRRIRKPGGHTCHSGEASWPAPVRWTQTVRALLALAPTVIECGPGKVLSGLVRRIDRTASCYALEDPESVAAAVAATATGEAPV